MTTALILLGCFLAPISLALLYAIWDDTMSPRHKRHMATMREMEERTDRAWDDYCRREGLPPDAYSRPIKDRARDARR